MSGWVCDPETLPLMRKHIAKMIKEHDGDALLRIASGMENTANELRAYVASLSPPLVPRLEFDLPIPLRDRLRPFQME